LWGKKTPRMRITVTSSSNENIHSSAGKYGGEEGGGGTLPPSTPFYSRRLLERYLKTTWTVFPPPQIFTSWRKLRILGNWSTNIHFLTRITHRRVYTHSRPEVKFRRKSLQGAYAKLLYFLHKKVLKSVKNLPLVVQRIGKGNLFLCFFHCVHATQSNTFFIRPFKNISKGTKFFIYMQPIKYEKIPLFILKAKKISITRTVVKKSSVHKCFVRTRKMSRTLNE
jgi:hypothetical protein